MVVIIRRSVIEVKEEQPQKTQVPRAVIVDASVTDISEDQQEKALFCIVVMLDGIKIVLILGGLSILRRDSNGLMVTLSVVVIVGSNSTMDTVLGIRFQPLQTWTVSLWLFSSNTVLILGDSKKLRRGSN